MLLQDILPAMKNHPEEVVGSDIPGESEAGFDVFVFVLEGSKDPVKNDQDASVVFVDVLRVRSVMDAVVRRGVEDKIKIGNPPYQLGMLNKGKQETKCLNGEDHDGVKSGKEQRYPEEVVQHDIEERYPGGCGKIHFLGGMMIDMNGPQESVLVAESMKPVIE
jgi:hypothetical protein